MSDPYLGEIRAFPYAYAPKGWALCDGSLLEIAKYPGLFSLLGVAYGGDGRVTFGVPNLTGRVAVGDGRGEGLTPRSRGDMGGAEALPLTAATLSAHRHSLVGSSNTGTGKTPSGAMFSSLRKSVYRKATGGTGTMSPLTLASTGEGKPDVHENRQPSLVLAYCIAVEGTYPPE